MSNWLHESHIGSEFEILSSLDQRVFIESKWVNSYPSHNAKWPISGVGMWSLYLLLCMAGASGGGMVTIICVWNKMMGGRSSDSIKNERG